MYVQIFTIISPIIFIALLGYIWSHLELRYDGKFVTKIVMDVGTPCLILSTMLSARINVEQLMLISLVTVSGLLVLFMANSLLVKITGVSYRTYLTPLSFANTGNMGVPICLFAFGDQGLALALVIFMVTSMIHFSLGISLVGGEHPLKTLFTSPVFYAACLSFFFLFTGFKLPKSIFNTIDLLGGLAIPLMIFALGVSLHDLHAKSIGRSLFFGVMRLLIGLATGMFLCWLFDLSGMLRGVVLIQSAMPSAVFNYLLALRYKREPEEVAGVVIFSTLLSFLTLPFLLWYIL